MFKMLLLVCATDVSPAQCGIDTAIDIIQGPAAQSAAACAFQGQVQVAATVLPIRPGETYLKVRCTRERPETAPQIADDEAAPAEEIAATALYR
jgi:hypothetical protein